MAKAGAALSNCINDLRRSGPETHVGTGFRMGTPRAKREPASRGLVLSVERERLQRLQRCASPMCFQVNMSSFFPLLHAYVPPSRSIYEFHTPASSLPSAASLPNINLTLFQTTARSRFRFEALPWGSMAGEVPLGRLWVRAEPRCEIGSCRCPAERSVSRRNCCPPAAAQAQRPPRAQERQGGT